MQYLFSESHEDGMSGRRCIRGAFHPYFSVRLDYILESRYRLSLSLLHPFLHREGSRPFPTKTRDLAVYFVASPSTRRPSSCFLHPPSGRALPSPSTKGTTEQSSSALSVFLSSSPRPPPPPLSSDPGFLSIAVIRLRLRRQLLSLAFSRSLLRRAGFSPSSLSGLGP